MAKLGINTGTSPDAGDGDALLTGAIKINSNFDEVYNLLGDGTNLAPGIVTSIVAGTNVTVSGSTGQVTINASSGGGSSSQWETTAAGIHTLSNVGIGTTNPTSALTVKGDVNVSGVSTFGAQVNINTGGSSKLNIGAPNDLYLQWDEGGQSASLDTSATGNLYVQNNANGGIFLNAGTSNQAGVHLYPSDRVELRHAASKKFETLGAGVTVTGTTFTDQLSVSGVSTFSGDIKTNESNVVLGLSGGVTDDRITWNTDSAEVYADSSRLYLKSQLANGINIFGTGTIALANYGGTKTHLLATEDGSVDLYYDNSKKFETLGAGVTVTGTTFTNQLSVSGFSTFTNNLSTIHQSGLNPGIRLTETNGSNLIGMYYDTSSTQSYLISDQKNLNIKVYSPQYVYIRAGDEVMALFQSNGPVSLYYDNVKKFETLGTGVTVTGTTFTNQLSVSGVSTLIGSVGIGTTNSADGYDLTIGVSNTGIRTTSLRTYGYANINGLTVKGNSSSYTDNVIITQHPASNFTGNRNIAIGDYSFTTPGAAGENVAIGYYALNVVGNNDTLNTYNGNTAVGAFAGQSVTTTLKNTFIGNYSGRYITTGGENTILGGFDGNQNGLDIRTSSNNVVLSDGVGNIRFYANSSGNVGLGTTNPTVKLEVNGSARVGIDTSSGVILTSPNGTKYQLFVEDDGTLNTVAV